jgi:hypothetical protein
VATRADFVIRRELHVRGEPKRGIRSPLRRVAGSEL